MGDLIPWMEGDSNQQRGEFVLLVKGAEAAESELDAKVVETMKVLLAELPVKQAAAIGAKLTGMRKNELYQWALSQQ